MNSYPKKRYRDAFSLIEAVIAIGALAMLATVGFATFHGTFEAASDGKLRSDVAALNSAVRVYQASGGDLSSADTAAKVMTRLKSQSTAARARRLTGVSSSVIDTRLSFRMQSQGEADNGELRAQWNTSDQQFVIAVSGAPGIKEFYLQEQGQATVEDTTDQRAGSMLFAEQSGWIWDYQDRAVDAPPVPTVIPVDTTGLATAAAMPAPTTLPPPPVVPPAVTLSPPTLDQAGGIFAVNLFPLSVTMTNPNAAGSSKIVYSVDAGAWQDYAGPLSISPDSELNARSVPVVTGYLPSALVSHLYEAESITLGEPLITPDRTTFGLFYQTDVTVTLSDPNASGTSITRYRVDGGAWQDYSAPFLLTKSNHPTGAIIEAQAMSSGSPYYLPSPVAQSFIGRESINLTGTTSGAFHDPFGPAGMISNLAAGSSNSHFAWGDGTSQAGMSQSWMDYSGSTLADMSEGIRFKVGELTYYNGTILSGSGADTIDLAIELSLNINGNTFNPFFDFTFELINTPNSGVDEWTAADYVRLGDPVASRTLVINGNEFEFRVEFGETSADGFAAFNEFHVLENKDAAVNVYGTLISLGPVAGAGGGESDKGGVVLAVDEGTGTADDPVFQMAGYVDLLEHSGSLEDIAKRAEETAKSNRDIANDGLADALKGSNDISRKIDEAKYAEAAALAVDAAAGAAAAEDAAKVAEAAAALAYDAAEAAKMAYGEALTPEDAKAAEDTAVKVIDHATKADAFAAEARAAADEAATYAAFTAAVVANFENDALSPAFGEEADDDDGSSVTPEDYAQYLAAAAKTARENAKKAWEEAEAAAKHAVDYANETIKKTNEVKFDEAETKASDATTAATVAENAALRAEAEAATASDAATKAASIAASYPTAAGDATLASDEAALALTFAVDARTAATNASIAANDAKALVATNP